MVCVVVGINGRGRAWRHESREAAEEHPLTQYGDAVLCGPDDILREYSLMELSWLLGAARAQDMAPLISDWCAAQGEIKDRVLHERLVERWGKSVWDRLTEAAEDAPSDPSMICNLVRADRRQELKMAKQSAKKDAASAARSKATTTKSAQPAAGEAPAKKVAGFPLSARITFGADGEGKKYGAANNPKRQGTAAADTFALYKDGMTIQQALDAGVSASDIAFNQKRGFVKIAG